MYREVCEFIEFNSEESFKKFSERIVNSPTPMAGVRVPVLRKYARRLVLEQSIDNIMLLPDNQYVEIDFIKGICVAYCKSSDAKKQLGRFATAFAQPLNATKILTVGLIFFLNLQKTIIAKILNLDSVS